MPIRKPLTSSFQKKYINALLLSGLGGMLEFYDFIIYALMATYISQLFFSTQSATVSLLITFSAYAVGYFVRPLGGIIFGHFGDKYGRKKTFTVSILIMALSTVAIGLLPTYNTIGLWAPCLLILCRIAQGFSVGGEIPGAITYVGELLDHKKGLATGVIFFFLILGVVLGYLIESLLLSSFSSDQMLAYGWRFAFIIGGVFGLIAYYLRFKLLNIEQFNSFEPRQYKLPISKVLLTHQWNLIYASIIVSFGALCFVTLFLFLPVYITSILNLNLANFTWLNSIGIFIFAVLIIPVGYISDKCDRTLILIITTVLTVILSFVIYYIYNYQINMYFFALVFSAIICALCWGNIPAMLIDMFKSDIRYSGIGLSYNLGFAVFGGVVPLIAIALIEGYKDMLAPAYMLIIGSIITFITVIVNHYIIKK